MKKLIGKLKGPITCAAMFAAAFAHQPASAQAGAMPSTAQFDVPNPPDPVVDLPGGVEGLLDITYLERWGYRPLNLDLYRPRKATGRLPLVIYVHGGSFLQGSGRMPTPAFKNGMDGLLAMLAAHGYATAAVEYRLGGEALMPAGILDMKAAIRWLRANADKYNLDPNRFAVFGDSAGGGAAALLGTSCGAKEFAENYPPSRGGPDLSKYSDCVQASIDWFGIIDMAQLDSMWADTPEVKTPLYHNNADSTQSQVYGCVLGHTCKSELVQMYNPIKYIDPSDKGTAFMMVHGTGDVAVSWKQPQMFYDKLREAGITARLELLPGLGHYFMGATDQDVKKITSDMLEFLDQTIGKNARR